MASDSTFLVRADDLHRAPEREFHHPLNPDSHVFMRALGDVVGMERSGVSLARVPPGRESFIYHSHRIEEEWVFIVSGSATAVIDGEEFSVGAGDFMGFPTPSVPHTLINSGDEDLVYVMGGERRRCEIAEFPRLGKFVVRDGERAYSVDRHDLKPFWPPEE